MLQWIHLGGSGGGGGGGECLYENTTTTVGFKCLYKVIKEVTPENLSRKAQMGRFGEGVLWEI